MLVAASHFADKDLEQRREILELLGRPNLVAAEDSDSWRRGIAEQWASATKQAEDAARDVCTLMVLYIEHCREIPPDSAATASLSKFLSRVQDYRRTQTEHFDIMFAVMLGIMVYSFFGGIVISLLRGMNNPTIEGVKFGVTAVLTYVPAMWLASEIRASALARGKYLRPGENWAALSTYAWIFVCSYAAALCLLAVYNIVLSLWAAEIADISIGAVIFYAFIMEMPRALLGGTLSVFVAIALDARGLAAGTLKIRLSVLHGLTLFALFLVAADLLSYFSLDDVDWILTAMHGLLPAGIGAVSTLVIFKMTERPDNEEYDDVGPIDA